MIEIMRDEDLPRARAAGDEAERGRDEVLVFGTDVVADGVAKRCGYLGGVAFG